MNVVHLIGNIGKDPEAKTFDNGQVATRFSLATSKTFKDKQGEKQEQTEWHTVKTWGKTAEIVRDYLQKGDQVVIEGEITYRSYEKDGQKKYFTEIVANRVHWLKVKGKGENASSQPEPVTNNAGPDDDLPF